LIEAEKGFVERDLDAKLGYGAPYLLLEHALF